MTNAQKKLQAAIVDFLCMQPFFGSLALSMPFLEDLTCETAWTDGRNIGYNPAFIDSLDLAKTQGLIAHEVMHVAMGHPWRRDARDPEQWNVACDYAINGDLKLSGFALPDNGLFPDAAQQGKSAEWIYARLPPQKKQPKSGGQGSGNPQNGKGKSQPAGEVRDAPKGTDADGNPPPTEGEWKQRVAEAAQQAKMAGNLPAGLARLVEEALQTRVDIKALLLRFFTERINADYSWNMPNRRFAHLGIFLPSLDTVSMGEIAVLCDTSGSISGPALQFARGILQQCLDEVNPAGITLYFVDTKIHGIQRMERGDPLTWEPKGGGGTNFKSCFETIEASEVAPVCIIGISDLDATFPVSCSIPTLWLTDSATRTAPFGEITRIDR